MSDPSRRQIIEAYEALEELRDSAREQAGLVADAKYDTILEALPSKPELTMADIEWDDDKHYLAEAEHSFFGKVIMLGEGPLSGCIRITSVKNENVSKMPMLWQSVEPESLTPTGKRYALKEEQSNDH